MSTAPTLLRCWRDAQSVLHISLNGVEQAFRELDTSDDFNNPSQPIIFGSNNTGGEDFLGWINSIRVYRGGYLREHEASRLYAAKPSAFVMKFAGRVVNVNDKQSPKTVQCRSFSNILRNQILSPEYDCLN